MYNIGMEQIPSFEQWLETRLYACRLDLASANQEVERAKARLGKSRKDLDEIEECIKLVRIKANFPQAKNMVEEFRKEFTKEFQFVE